MPVGRGTAWGRGSGDMFHAPHAEDDWFADLVQASGEVLWVSDATRTHFHYVSPVFDTVLGFSRAEFYESPNLWRDSVHPEDVDRVRRVDAFSSIEPYEQEYRLNRRDGTQRWVLERGFPVHDGLGNVVRLVGTVRDITQCKAGERALRESQRKLDTLVSNIPGVVYRCSYDANWTVEYVSDGALSVLGYSPEEILHYGMSPADFVYPADLPTVMWVIEKARRTGRPYRITYRIIHRDNTLRWLWQQGRFVCGGRVLEGFAMDVTQRRVDEQRIRSLAFYDPGTGLANRASCLDHLADALAGAEADGESVALLMLNLNRFKEVNDTLGHAAGDQLLKAVSYRLNRALAEGEFLARLGGDEFAVVASGVTGDEVSPLLARIHGALKPPFEQVDTQLTIGATVGIALFPANGGSGEELIQHADIALHQAKHEKADHWYYEPELLQSLNEQLRLAQRFRKALERDALSVHYQPQVHLSTGGLVGVEALIRWYDQEWGWISPSFFLPVVEQRQMMGMLFDWVLNAVARDLESWQATGYALPPYVSVNVAAEQLHDGWLADRLEAVIREKGLRPDMIGVEITETGIMRDPEQAARLVERLRLDGASVAIDDFGTGYSSLAYLKHLSADTLKIDLSFIRDMLTDSSDQAIVSTIIAMAGTLGMRCIAEGVETDEHRRALVRMGCRQGQGILFDPPQPAGGFAERWLSG